MILLTPAMRLTVVLSLVTVNLMVVAHLIGFFPDESKLAAELRKEFVESLAIQFCSAAEKGQFQLIQNTLRNVVERNKEVLSAAIRTNSGRLIAMAGEHMAHYRNRADGKSTLTNMNVPLFRQGQKWATVEISFAPLWTNNLAKGFKNSFLGLIIFLGLSGFVCYFFIIKKILRELDPSKVIPERVQRAFDILQEGVVILDVEEHIVMANKAFAALFGKSSSSLIGMRGSELGWVDGETSKPVDQLPWFNIVEHDGQEQEGALLGLRDDQGRKIKLMVRAVKVTDNSGKVRGALVTFDNITQLEEKNLQLRDLVEKLKQANEEIMGKTQELEILASCDPMTLCLNRRSFGQRMDRHFSEAKEKREHLSCLMLDIDFFKSVNDRYGHATGDQVIKAIADVLKVNTRDTDLVSRYGGEEFCVLLPKLDLRQAAQVGERIRQAVEKKSCSGVKVTVSIGVATLDSHINKPDELVNQADKALYAAKKGGRNRVVTWGRDLEVVADSDGKVKVQEQSLQPNGQSGQGDRDTEALRRRIMELEGLLEKRTLELQHYEIYDFKTGLPTRSLFEDRIKHEIARSRRNNCLFAVLSLNIHTIRRIHETHGPKAAEELLNACVERLNEILRKDIDTVVTIKHLNGISTVSLINQTEFGILLTDIRQVDHVTWVIKRLLDSFERPFSIRGNEIYASAYLGVSIFPYDGHTVDELCSSATNACSYAQKRNGKQRYLFSSQSLNESAVTQLKMENLLHEVLQKDELHLHYQPILEAVTGRIIKFEALLRWNSAVLGFVPPDQFIPIMEQSGQIDEVGDWVIYNACRQLREWLDTGLEMDSIAVNISVLQLRQRNLSKHIEEVLAEFDIDPHMLEIELTESSFLNINHRTFANLKQIRDIGVRLAMDDFGTGYSSLSYLNKIPLSSLKIDRSFVIEINREESANKLITSIISLAHGLGLEVVAEGVEERYQADYLTALGCEFLQGYYFSRPIPPSEVVDILSKPGA